ncbi:hypothetical protein J23TS9_38250 [Paenibacillus sp. J23TS9]|nr:hypothetical protein J23TS9_38250 [Paenibacillus sp. J23TS9]
MMPVSLPKAFDSREFCSAPRWGAAYILTAAGCNQPHAILYSYNYS